MSTHKPRWTIAELDRKVADALAQAGYEGPANGQVRAVPNQRSIRYYTTLGLLDRAVEMRGRTALYGPVHLMQLVAIKRLQAKGLSLTEVQQVLAGASRRKLARIADVPRAVWAFEGEAEDASPAAAPGRQPARGRFWAEVPPEPAAGPDAQDDLDAGAAPEPAGAPVLLASAVLMPGVTLMFEPERLPDAADTQALRRAAAQLLDELATRGLVAAPCGTALSSSHAPVARAARTAERPGQHQPGRRQQGRRQQGSHS